MPDHQVNQDIQITLQWSDVEDQPVLFANVFMVQNNLAEETFFLTLGAAAPLIPHGQKSVAQLRREGVKVTPIARVSLSPPKMVELIGHLQTNYRNYQNSIVNQARQAKAEGEGENNDA